LLDDYFRRRKTPLEETSGDDQPAAVEAEPAEDARPEMESSSDRSAAAADLPPLNRKQLSALLTASGSHPRTLARSLQNVAGTDAHAQPLIELAGRIDRSAKDEKLLEILRQSGQDKVLVFANLRRTLEHIQELLSRAGIPFVTYSGAESEREKDAAVETLRQQVPVMLCSESGGEGRNLQFANTLVNFDLPWNPMKIEQRVGRIHRIGQTREVFIFNLCTAGSLEARLLDVLNEKIRMFELVVGEVGSILGNLQGGEEFESLVLNLWLRSHNDHDLERSFQELGDSLVQAQEEYVRAKELDEALFGEDYQ
jgi:SNF2 family DNA or RNA helicase